MSLLKYPCTIISVSYTHLFAKELLPKTNIDDLKVLAAIATITDIMPLEGANRPLVRDGLRLINKGRTVPGMRQLLKMCIRDSLSAYPFLFSADAPDLSGTV